jgi:hypothetical protein
LLRHEAEYNSDTLSVTESILLQKRDPNQRAVCGTCVI